MKELKWIKRHKGKRGAESSVNFNYDFSECVAYWDVHTARFWSDKLLYRDSEGERKVVYWWVGVFSSCSVLLLLLFSFSSFHKKMCSCSERFFCSSRENSSWHKLVLGAPALLLAVVTSSLTVMLRGGSFPNWFHSLPLSLPFPSLSIPQIPSCVWATLFHLPATSFIHSFIVKEKLCHLGYGFPIYGRRIQSHGWTVRYTHHSAYNARERSWKYYWKERG